MRAAAVLIFATAVLAFSSQVVGNSERSPDDLDVELRQLLEQHRATLKAAIELQEALVREHKVPPFQHVDLQISLTEVELELAASREERLAVHESNVTFFRLREEYAQAKARAGFRDISDILPVQIDRQRAEIAMHRERLQ